MAFHGVPTRVCIGTQEDAEVEIGQDYLLGIYRDESYVEYLQVFDLHKEGGPRRPGP